MKIGLCGTMSVGKTTLVNALKEIPQFKDYAIATERSKYLNSLGIPLNHKTTIEGQTIFLAERVTELMQENIITDRTIIDVMAFANNSNSMNYIEADDFCQFASHMLSEYDHIFYVSPKGVEMEDNGVRETDVDYRTEIDRSIQLLTLKYNNKIKNLTKIEGSTEERIKLVKQAIFS